MIDKVLFLKLKEALKLALLFTQFYHTSHSIVVILMCHNALPTLLLLDWCNTKTKSWISNSI